LNLVKELHQEGCNNNEILERLRRGQTSTGQAFTIHVETLYNWLKRLGLRPHNKLSWFKRLQDEAMKLHDEGKSYQQIADLFNKRGTKSLLGKDWSKKLVFNLVSALPRKPDLFSVSTSKSFETRRTGV
jgi:hypothetical protein